MLESCNQYYIYSTGFKRQNFIVKTFEGRGKLVGYSSDSESSNKEP
jgi:hypothetical protein